MDARQGQQQYAADQFEQFEDGRDRGQCNVGGDEERKVCAVVGYFQCELTVDL